MTRQEQIVRQLQNLERGAAGLALRYPAHFNLHLAACLNGDREEITRRRDELHTVLDALLDNTEAVQHLQRELVRLGA